MKTYFKIEEFERSEIAEAFGIDNTMGENDRKDYQYLIDKVLNPIRENYGKAIYINSGYRCPELNNHKKIKGVKNSQHLSLAREAAADIDTRKGAKENEKLYKLIIKMMKNREIIFDQCIDEKDFQWIHISIKLEGTNRLNHFEID